MTANSNSLHYIKYCNLYLQVMRANSLDPMFLNILNEAVDNSGNIDIEQLMVLKQFYSQFV